MFINDFELKIHLYNNVKGLPLLTIEDNRDNGCVLLPSVNIELEKVTPELIGERIKEYIESNVVEQNENEEQHKEETDNSKGWTVVFYPWDDDSGKPRVAGRFKTTKEKDDFIETISKPDSGWLTEELNTLYIIDDYNYMLPV